MVFVDNLYMYGPQTAPLVESMPLADYGVKPAVRSQITRMWMAASAAGRIRALSLRAPDFYGPGVGQSHLGDIAIGALARDKRAMCVGSPDTPHDFAYVPDIGRAVMSLLAAPDSAYGEAWHMPCAPTQTRRRLLDLAAAALGRPLKLFAMPFWALGAASLVSADMKEIWEMRFQWDRPYRVDADRFARTFWNDPTPFEEGIPATALAFRRAAA
jgi:nucleoside-diphosphate-sugar epimerase